MTYISDFKTTNKSLFFALIPFHSELFLALPLKRILYAFKIYQINIIYNRNNKGLNYLELCPVGHLLLQLRFSELVQSHQKPQNQNLEAFPQHPWY